MYTLRAVLTVPAAGLLTACVQQERVVFGRLGIRQRCIPYGEKF